MVKYRWTLLLLSLLLLAGMQLSTAMAASAGCPLNISDYNVSRAAIICSDTKSRASCCRYINALVAVSIVRYANITNNLGVTPELSNICLQTISDTLELHGMTKNATVFCGFGTKIPVNYECLGITTVNQMLQSPKFSNVTLNCRVPFLGEDGCKKCLNAGILYLRNVVGAGNNTTLSTCRDAAFVALASQVDGVSAIEIADCFFGVQGLANAPVSGSTPSSFSPKSSPSPFVAASPSQLSLSVPNIGKHHSYHLSLVPGIGIAVTAVATMMLVLMVFLIRRKSRELDGHDMMTDKTSIKMFQEVYAGPSSMFMKFSYREVKKATNNFSTLIGQGGFGTVYKAQFSDGSTLAVKRMDKVSEQAVEEFCREIELLARLHHRHLVALKGFCIKKHERFLMYEYMANGSLKDHLHTPGIAPLSWQTRIQIAIDVANALEYLHFYCDPPLCHRDIKSSNILLDENFIAKVADFGLAYASKDGSICFEPVNTEIRGTPGHMDPEYVVSQELTEKSDIYSYGVVLLELVTSRRAIHDNKNLVESCQSLMASESRLGELVDPAIGDSFDLDQLQTVVTIVKLCTQREGRGRPSIKQVLKLLYECADPMHNGFIEAVEDERGRTSKGKMHRRDGMFQSWDGQGPASSSSTSRSYCSRSFLLETGSPQSPSNAPSI
ncbi:probable receptor-like protein kinase At1g49730 [Cynara cardunculus var. scolymus]|uniref:probable receptor-like protein kinase At1g49730 n=1 Tax=Cynara cardunculus var. scolymus TaxID=59895 RepID=UPI000D628895|nr:probable receptor-like protein kinase At1g49730 [Cynara cardunculus var. scolymus]